MSVTVISVYLRMVVREEQGYLAKVKQISEPQMSWVELWSSLQQ